MQLDSGSYQIVKYYKGQKGHCILEIPVSYFQGYKGKHFYNINIISMLQHMITRRNESLKFHHLLLPT